MYRGRIYRSIWLVWLEFFHVCRFELNEILLQTLFHSFERRFGDWYISTYAFHFLYTTSRQFRNRHVRLVSKMRKRVLRWTRAMHKKDSLAPGEQISRTSSLGINISQLRYTRGCSNDRRATIFAVFRFYVALRIEALSFDTELSQSHV